MKTRKGCRILVRKFLSKRPQESTRKKTEGNIMAELKDISREDSGGREVIQDPVHQ